jgi:hypothetical protein
MERLATRTIPEGQVCFSHVGMVVTSDILDGLQPGEIYVWESTSSLGSGVPALRLQDDESGSKVFRPGRERVGVQLRDMQWVSAKYRGDIMWCPVKDNPLDRRVSKNPEIEGVLQETMENRRKSGSIISLGKREDSTLQKLETLEKDIIHADIRKRFTALFMAMDGGRYQMSPTHLGGALFGCCRPVRDTVGVSLGVFCSELVAMVYQEFGILSEEIRSGDVLPMDFIGYDRDDIPIVVKLPPQEWIYDRPKGFCEITK